MIEDPGVVEIVTKDVLLREKPTWAFRNGRAQGGVWKNRNGISAGPEEKKARNPLHSRVIAKQESETRCDELSFYSR